MGSVFGGLPPWLQDAAVDVPQNQLLPNEYFTPRMRRMQEDRPTGAVPNDFGDPLMALPPFAKAISAAPKLATAALTAYYGLSGTDPAHGAQPSGAPSGNAEDIKQLQQELRQFGYSGPIDGVWKAGTQRAYEAKQQADQMHMQQQQLGIQKELAEAQKRDAEARDAETKRQAEADALKAQQREQGQQRYNEAESNVGGFSRLLRDYGTPAGVTVGALVGPAARALVTRAAGGPAREVASMMSNKLTSTPDRVGRINEVWRQGGQGGAVPFTNMPGQKPGFAANPNAASPGELFKPNKALNMATDVGVMGGFGGEAAATGYLAHGWEQELQKASEAAAADPSDINIGRLQTAKDNVAFYESLSNAGRAAIPSYLTASKFMKRPGAPNLSGVEGEKLKLEKLLPRRSPVAEALVGNSRPSPTLLGPPAPGFAGPAGFRQRQIPYTPGE